MRTVQPSAQEGSYLMSFRSTGRAHQFCQDAAARIAADSTACRCAALARLDSKLRLGLLFGGRSCEHEVSLMSARNIYQALDPDRFEVRLIGISKDGQWLLDYDVKSIQASSVESDGLLPVALDYAGDKSLTARKQPIRGAEQLGPLDVIFPVLHGPFGEDGTVQGLLELADIAYVGSGVAGSAVGMDKGIANMVFEAEGIPQAKFKQFRVAQWEADPEAVYESLSADLSYPMFVKPANLGSSVGISKVSDPRSLAAAFAQAAQFDIKIVVEESLENCHEVEVSILGNEAPQASTVGEIVPGGEFYDYSDKYLDGTAQLLIPARISDAQAKQVQDYAIRAFKAVDAAGLARVDFFASKDSSDVYINEINTMPGFTNISMYPKLWEASGIGYADLIEMLIELALERRRRKNVLRTAF